MHEHAYIGCEHALKHCKHCDVAYCEKCKREWKQPADNRASDYFKKIQAQPFPPTNFGTSGMAAPRVVLNDPGIPVHLPALGKVCGH